MSFSCSVIQLPPSVAVLNLSPFPPVPTPYSICCVLLASTGVRIANMMASDGPSWARFIGIHNSGTYTNQYMIVDLKKFEPYGELQAGLLTIAEVMPGKHTFAHPVPTITHIFPIT